MGLKTSTFKRKKLLVVAIIIVAVSAIMMGFSTALAKNVNLIIDGKVKEVTTYSETVGDFLKTQNIKLHSDNLVIPGEEEKITEDMDIIVAEYKYYVIIDGKQIYSGKSINESVKDILKDLKIELDEDDVVTPGLLEKVKERDTIKIERVERQSYQTKTEIPYESEIVENADMYNGESKIIQKGVVGEKVDTFENVFVNGELVSIEPVDSQITIEPVKEIVEKGTKEIDVANLEGKKVKKVIVMQATAYDPTAGSKTAMGTKARVGAVAVDPRVIPLGSKLYIESMDGFPTYGYATAEDTGGAIKGNRIDLFYSTNAQALKFGRRNVKVYVLE
ncbi:3D domain-containing protein [Peptoniphilus catoniae]|uniref:3D domain-containing protein n=1 Tax=Peptoniphilus catoniae TaxID=1660341 RepID=UPI0010FD601E|nr:3D domain-containing protein [Peptoniphilus catoniae]